MKPRQYILEVLMRVFQENAYASLIMRDNNMPREDMPFISEVVYGTIRNYDMLEYQWRSYAKGHVKKKIALLLDMSIYQMQYLDGVPEYAVISEAVEMTGTYEKKFVNAVLRNVAKRGQIFPHGNDLASLAVRPAIRCGYCRCGMLTMGKRSPVSSVKKIRKASLCFRPYQYIEDEKGRSCQRADRVRFLNEISFQYDGILSRTSMFKEGKVVIQDVNSAETVKYLDVQSRHACVGSLCCPWHQEPGDGNVHAEQGQRSLACDLYEKRTHLIDELMHRTGVTICQTMVNDATVHRTEWENGFDRVLVDAPCSGLGDLRHKPEIRLHLNRKIWMKLSMSRKISCRLLLLMSKQAVSLSTAPAL
jgi:16S rRNA (cytosine967-C5)-methyltransferase